MSPPAADLSKLVPPTFAFPSPTRQDDIQAFMIAFIQKNWLTVAKDIEQGIIVEDIDACTSFTGAAMGHKLMLVNVVVGQSIPRADYYSV